jgi:hypothetical protein
MLHVPAESVNAYWAADPWKNFKSIVSITDGMVQIPAKALLIQSQGGVLTVQGADDGTRVGVYSINGTLAGEGISRNGCAVVNTNLQPGSVAIIKIGDRSVKVMVK